jgi:AAA+ superfamily predicted ATPase
MEVFLRSIAIQPLISYLKSGANMPLCRQQGNNNVNGANRKRFVMGLLCALLILFCLPLLAGCSKGEASYVTDSGKWGIQYNEDVNTTTITVQMDFKNDTNREIKRTSITFEYYYEGVKQGQVSVMSDSEYLDRIEKGNRKTLTFTTKVAGRVDDVKRISEDFTQASFWDTYSTWFYIGIPIAISALFMLGAWIGDFIEDIWDWLTDEWYHIPIVLLGLGVVAGIVCGFIFWIWWAMLIILGAIILIGAWIGYFIEDIWDWLTDEWYHIPIVLLGLGVVAGIVCGFIFWIWWAMLIILGAIILIGGTIGIIVAVKNRNDYAYLVSHGGYTRDGYESKTVVELKNECRSRGLTGFSSLRKDELVAILEENDSEEETVEKEEQPRINPSTKIGATLKDGKSAKSSRIPTIKLTDIAGLDEAKIALEERVILPIKHRDVYVKYGKQTGGGILLFGLPGTGKTMFAQAVATELDAQFFSVKCSDIESKWTGEAERRVKELFAKAKRCVRAVIFFDEFDSLGRRRTEENDNGSYVVQEILTQMQGVEASPNTLLVIAATNCPWNLDGALLRPGRFNEKIYIPLPDKSARLFILERGLKNCNLAESVCLSDIADRLYGCNGADVAEFCEKVKMILIRREIAKNKNLVISVADIESLLTRTKSSVLQRDIDKMDEFLKTM